jgi:hypothetical protein
MSIVARFRRGNQNIRWIAEGGLLVQSDLICSIGLTQVLETIHLSSK